MFSKVLISNRGEIACRIIRTCKRLGIATAAVYSDTDKNALHVQMADEAYRIGESPARDSYLRIDRIVKAAKQAKADAVHHGYGFLAENPRLPIELAKENIQFIGPSAELIASMGDKVAARRMAHEAKLPVVPGTETEIDDEHVSAAALEVGFPLLIKAADGGGGMGIRLVQNLDDLEPSIERARAQALGSFGSSRVYFERQILHASHIEVQVLADHHGNVIHLHERDCSVQRRHQKVIEETPSSKLTPQLRKKITEAAVRLTKRIGYTNAGTIEFLVAPTGEYYFLEMNTRLQVEHPITELITGLDIVELQLRVAAGEPLPIDQSAVKLHGHAIEARIYPEDPTTLLPMVGTVTTYEEPQGEHVRVDSALFPGYEVNGYYEPLMAKVISWGDHRKEATDRLKAALEAFIVEGVVTNIPMITRVLDHPLYSDASYDTGLLEYLLNAPQARGKELIATIALAMVLDQNRAKREGATRWKMEGRRQLLLNRLSSGTV